MGLGHFAHDGQSEAGATHFPGTPLVHPEEALEQVPKTLGGDARTVVSHLDDGISAFPAQEDVHGIV